MENAINKVYELVGEYGLKIAVAIVILVIGWWLAKLISKLVGNSLQKANVEITLSRFAEHLAYFALMTFVVIAALGAAGIKTASFVAVLGAAGLAVGLALQGSLSNFAAGVLMLIFKPFKVGDFVEAGGILGTVKEIQIFCTILASPDNVKIIVPNSKITSAEIKNYVANNTRRVDLVMGVSYEDDLKKAADIMKKVLEADERILKDPAPTVAVVELGDSSVNFVVRPWVNPANYWDVYFDVTEKIKVALEAGGCSIPFPQRDVHMFNEQASA